MIEIGREALTDETAARLIALSALWVEENCSFGMVKNSRDDLREPLWTARDNGVIVGYLFGRFYRQERRISGITPGSECFEIDELYVLPEYRSQRIGGRLFAAMEADVGTRAAFLTLTTSTKDWRKMLRFYTENAGMTFHNAFFFKPTAPVPAKGAAAPGPKKLLLTAFDPFGGEAVNAAAQAAALLPARVGGIEITRLTVPTVFYRSIEAVTQAARALRPDFILCLGQAAGRDAVTPERVAINVNDARIPYNAGNQPADAPVFPGEAAAYFSTLPIKAMADAIRGAGVPARISDSAGTFVCNHLLYGVLRLCARELPGTRAGFIHLPLTPEQAAETHAPCLSSADAARALEAAIAALERA